MSEHLRCVYLQVELKIIQHDQEECRGCEVVQGVLLGLVVDDRLEITNCFLFPQHTEDDADIDEGNPELGWIWKGLSTEGLLISIINTTANSFSYFFYPSHVLPEMWSCQGWILALFCQPYWKCGTFMMVNVYIVILMKLLLLTGDSNIHSNLYFTRLCTPNVNWLLLYHHKKPWE